MMDPLALEPSVEMDTPAQDKCTNDGKGDGTENISGVGSAAQEDSKGKRPAEEHKEGQVTAIDVVIKKKKTENEDKELMGSPAPVAIVRILSGTTPPGPTGNAGAIANSAGGGGTQSIPNSAAGMGKGKATGIHQGKSSGPKGGAKSQTIKQEGTKVGLAKEGAGEGEQQRSQDSALKVPPIKIVMPRGGGAGGLGDHYGEGGGKRGRRGGATLPYVMPCTSADFASPANFDEKRPIDTTKARQRVLRSNDGGKVKDEDWTPQKGRRGVGRARSVSAGKSPLTSGSGRGSELHSHSARSESVATSSPSTEVHSRKRKAQAAKKKEAAKKKDAHREAANSSKSAPTTSGGHPNPYQMYIQIRNQIDRRQRSLVPIKPKPPKDFSKYLMNRRTYTLEGNVKPSPVIVPADVPPSMRKDYLSQETERTRLRMQHLVEKEKLVLGVEQEILRVHGQAERASINQLLPFSVCTILRDANVFNLIPPDAEEKNKAKRLCCNGRQINAWLQEVDVKWEKIKEGMLRRQHMEAESLHAMQVMTWEWRLQEERGFYRGVQVNPEHVPQIDVGGNFDLPA